MMAIAISRNDGDITSKNKSSQIRSYNNVKVLTCPAHT